MTLFLSLEMTSLSNNKKISLGSIFIFYGTFQQTLKALGTLEHLLCLGSQARSFGLWLLDETKLLLSGPFICAAVNFSVSQDLQGKKANEFNTGLAVWRGIYLQGFQQWNDTIQNFSFSLVECI